ncbi:MAG: Protein RnfH [Pseudomonadota bacterium]|jgi:putative ubiquitin-RnfH superfamily antitoxin RatB of RatAB toxin-antitoxin module
MIRIQCLFSPEPRCVIQVNLSLPLGSLVKDALAQLAHTPEWQTYGKAQAASEASLAKLGIWGHLVQTSHPIKDGDRLEIYRSLLVDPKLARKQRFKRQGKGRTGLFARRRIGSVAGY